MINVFIADRSNRSLFSRKAMIELAWSMKNIIKGDLAGNESALHQMDDLVNKYGLDWLAKTIPSGYPRTRRPFR